jgi:hypothetical protein
MTDAPKRSSCSRASCGVWSGREQDNLSVILDTGSITKDDLCEGVDPATAPAACG